MADLLDNIGDQAVEQRVKAAATELCRRFPVYMTSEEGREPHVVSAL